MDIHFGREVTGLISKEEFELLPAALQAKIQEVCVPVRSADRWLRFRFPDHESAELMQMQITRFEENQYRAEYRRRLELTKSGGMFEKEDLRALFDAQGGRCYYTGVLIGWEPKDFSIDHMKPVRLGGSSWPGNLVLASRAANQEKHGNSARKYLALLAARHGPEWAAEWTAERRKIDTLRKKIDRERKGTVNRELRSIERKLQDEFVGFEISYTLVQQSLKLTVEHVEVSFPPGFIRNKKRAFSVEYLADLCRRIAIN